MNSEFSFFSSNSYTKVKEPSLSYYWVSAGGRMVKCIPFLRAVVLHEMQWAPSRIWARIAVSIFIDNNYYKTSSFLFLSLSFSVPFSTSFCNYQFVSVCLSVCLSLSLSLYIYIYIYVCVCVCEINWFPYKNVLIFCAKSRLKK